VNGLLAGARALVTGAAGGLGTAICSAFIGEGAAAIIAADTAAEALAEAVAKFGEAPCRVVPIEMDVSDPESWLRVVRCVRSELGGLDVLVNNAGTTNRSGIRDLELSEWNRVIAVNQTGVFLGMKSVAPLLADSNGVIVNIASFASITGYKAAAYTASKWAVRGLTRVAATEFGPLGIRVNSVSPGFVPTPLTRNAPEIVNAFAAATPIGRGCEPAEVADAVVYLASPRSSYLTGTDVLIDGGYSASSTRFITG
jgi:3alpha(or 20beta)-hydroxysteroid dehydrogenase